MEYLVWRTEDKAVDWWVLEQDEYRPIVADIGGFLQSRTFPGLWLDVRALLAGDGAKLIAKLQEGVKSPEHRASVQRLKR